MRLLALAGAFGLALAATGPLATQADAHPSATRFCALYKGGAENCGFYTFNQCLAALSGNGGICTMAPYQGDIIRVHTPYGPYRDPQLEPNTRSPRAKQKARHRCRAFRVRVRAELLRLLDRREQPVAARLPA